MEVEENVPTPWVSALLIARDWRGELVVALQFSSVVP